jgi:hydrogenase nickel incorporation protein HypA/HybF
MHESSLMTGLMKQISRVARENGGGRIVRVKVTLGALSNFSADHFREHFLHASRGTLADHAELDIHLDDDIRSPRAQDVMVESVEVAEE